MLNLRVFRIGFGRAAPAARPRPGVPRLALLAIALGGLLVEGCSSLGARRDACGGGGGGRCGLFRGCNLRLRNPFRRDVIVTDPCGEPGAIGVPIEGAPMVVPAVPGGAVIPAPAAPAEEIPSLEPAPTADSATPTTSNQASQNRKTLYETVRPSGGTTTSRREAKPAAATATRTAPDSDPLIDLPPLSAVAPAGEVTPPVAPAAEALASAAPAVRATEREFPSATPSAQPLSLTEGIARFKVVEPQLAAGSAPAAAGWRFLADKGYKTVLDLRPFAEVQPGDAAAANHAGLRHVVLPVTPEALDEALVRRFEDEIALAGNRPLYFFDTDGHRAAALWYLHLLAAGTLDETGVAAAVAEIGPLDSTLRRAVTDLLQNRRKAAAPPKPEPAPEPTAAAEPEGTAPAPVAAAALPTAPPSTLADESAPPARDARAWRPYAAMLLTGLSVPLAFYGRSAAATITAKLASLPAPAHRPRALPRSSGD